MVAQISLSDQPCCQFINQFPQWFFLVVHLAILVVAAGVAIRAFGGGNRPVGWGFALFALAEVSYLTYHVNLTLFLLAHTVAEVLVLLGIIAIAAGAVRSAAMAPSRPDAGALRR
ncbi:MAG TPA: hypothetical protein VHL78_11335 [Actinomycetota bacterium]|nr:hypothetical protein [Actinomycetota bacterium]